MKIQKKTSSLSFSSAGLQHAGGLYAGSGINVGESKCKVRWSHALKCRTHLNMVGLRIGLLASLFLFGLCIDLKKSECCSSIICY